MNDQVRIQSSTTQQYLSTNQNILALPLLPYILGVGFQSQINMPTLSNFYTIQDVSQHKSKDDCWIIVDGKVLTFDFFTSVFNAYCCVILIFGFKYY
jgi:cytochrome b involved in lipid metabolism